MISFLLRKIRNNKWLMLCLIFGNIILIATVSVVPLFISATNQRLFQEEFRNTQELKNIYPALTHLRFSFSAAQDSERYAVYTNVRDNLLPDAISQMGVPVQFEIQSYIISSTSMHPVTARELPVRSRSLQLSAPQGFENNIQLLHGRMPAGELLVNDGPTGGYIIEALAINDVMSNYDLLIDELMELEDIYAPDGSKLHVRVTGIFEPSDYSGEYWSVSSIHLRLSLLISNSLITENFINDYTPSLSVNAHWIQALDWQAMREDRIDHYAQAAEDNMDFFNEDRRLHDYSINFSDIIKRSAEDERPSNDETRRLDTIVWVLQIPIFVMLALFMYMVTKQILVIDSNDISVLKSRGVSRRQILCIYILQGTFVAAISFPAGLGLGILLCRVIGTSSGFLELADRASLSVRITDRTVLFGAVGIIISFLYMLLPVIRLSKIGIVESKRLKSNRNKKPLWEKYFLDVIAFAVSVYMLYNFHIQRWNIATTFQDERAFDPVMFFGSSLFIIGTALLLLRLYPYLMKLILLVGRNKFGPSIYTSIVKVSRSGGGEQLIMLFLVFTVAVGIFSAQTARTLNRNNEHRIRYTGGADITILEDWMDNMISEIHVAMGFSQPKFLVYREPDFNRFLEYEEVVSATRVLKQLALIRYGISRVEDATLLGIETDTFGETVWFRRGLSPIHINYFLNALAQNPNGVILSSNFRKLGYNIDNDIIITAPQKHGPSMVGEFKIVGFVDYWPSFKPTEVERLETGEVVFVDNYLAVANIEHLNSLIGVRPYQVWMKTDDSSHQFIYDFAEENVAFVRIIHDNDRSLLKILTDPVIQSTNGFLSIGFIMTMILCFAGFLIYWILSIKERLLQFGVFRAMGMGMRGIIGILVGEQILITVIALVIGGVIGEVTSQFYVPLLQISYTAADQVIPLMIVRSPMDFITIYGISGFMLVLSVIILVRYTLRMNVTQVLKLGED